MKTPLTDQGFEEVIKFMNRTQLQESMGVLNNPDIPYDKKFESLDKNETKAGSFQFDLETLQSNFNRIDRDKTFTPSSRLEELKKVVRSDSPKQLKTVKAGGITDRREHYRALTEIGLTSDDQMAMAALNIFEGKGTDDHIKALLSGEGFSKQGEGDKAYTHAPATIFKRALEGRRQITNGKTNY